MAATGRQLNIDLPRRFDCGLIAQRWVERLYAGVLTGSSMEDLGRTACELANHAYARGDGRIRLRLTLGSDRIRVELAGGSALTASSSELP